MGLPLKKTTKRVIFVFTALCGIFLIIFCVELIRINRDVSDAGAGSSISGGAQNGGAAGSESETNGAGSSDTTGSGDGPGGNGDTRPNGRPRPTLTGTRWDRPITGDMTLIYYIDGDVFEHTGSEIADILDAFSLRDDMAVSIQIRFVALPLGLSELAETFLSASFGIGDSIVVGEDYIGLSPLRGILTSGVSDGINFEAWIYQFTEEDYRDLGLAFIISYRTESQRGALYGVLDSLDIVYS